MIGVSLYSSKWIFVVIRYSQSESPRIWTTENKLLTTNYPTQFVAMVKWIMAVSEWRNKIGSTSSNEWTLQTVATLLQTSREPPSISTAHLHLQQVCTNTRRQLVNFKIQVVVYVKLLNSWSLKENIKIIIVHGPTALFLSDILLAPCTFSKFDKLVSLSKFMSNPPNYLWLQQSM